MKLPLFFLAFLCFIAFSACNDDDSDQNNSAIAGEWKLTAWYDDEARDIDNDGDASTDLLGQWDSCRKYSNFLVYDSGTSALVYKGSQNNESCPPPGAVVLNAPAPMPWSIQNMEGKDMLVLSGSDFEDVYEIVELNSNTLILKGSGFITCCDESISYYTGGYLKFTRVD